ncbi:hypothetical protein F4778DRAFT_712949 [Xylariomycetidae sp. FL2044]|nr:hypothetical protein F4778DRAFT_712949 [Xylariomycetidae sp. FL2044]
MQAKSSSSLTLTLTLLSLLALGTTAAATVLDLDNLPDSCQGLSTCVNAASRSQTCDRTNSGDESYAQCVCSPDRGARDNFAGCTACSCDAGASENDAGAIMQLCGWYLGQNARDDSTLFSCSFFLPPPSFKMRENLPQKRDGWMDR